MTTLTVSTTTAAAQPADCVVIGVATGPSGPALGAGAEAVSEAFGGGLAATLGSLGFTGAEGETLKLPAPADLNAEVVLTVGLGEAADDGTPTTEALRRAAGVASRALAGTGRAALALPAGTAEAAEAVALGGLLGSYAFTTYRAPGGREAPVGELVIPATEETRDEVESGVRRGTVIGEEMNRSRDLVNMPANHLTPETFADTVRAAGERYGLDVEVLDEQALAKESFGGILGVGQGSVRPPRLVRVAYTHPAARATLAFVGKGITYDSGGISLKPVGFNEIMKRDMSGAAAVFAAVVATARLRPRVNITGWLALAENMPSGSATRPGDVLRMYGGTTVEVLNTDAEGRLVLADALVRAGEEQPDAIVDVATLTAAMKMALGHRIFGVMSDDAAFRDQVLDAAGRAGEEAWPLPLPEHLRESLNSPVAEIANTGERMGGGLVAGLFLKEFVPSGVPWAHLDIAGPAFHEGAPYGYTPTGGTGSAVRTLVRLAEDAAAGVLNRPGTHR
ncbi:leucyl aminopeptidase [Streptomyces pactum]|uniref:Probable cytosol aminopeptidase n=1 Tax=Streptomyces pactum TaxID=68249 RepID=A0ABS0NDP6_9ACTN|nr:leucyl aminopeptidase [Streptomyces pactum]MBH5333281.1 leucyl aminopeptidase [Streptomyces pactum]